MMSVVPIEPPLPPGHVSVMPREVARALLPGDDELFLDFTAGGGGHSLAILETSSSARVIAFDRDPRAVAAARERLAVFGERATVVRLAFEQAEGWLVQHGITQVDGTVADLGVSSLQLDDPERGMSFRTEGPLDMRMDPDAGESARELIERLSQDELADLIYEFGEERASRRVARCIKQALTRGELETTLDLRRAVVRAMGPRRVGGVDPATRTFQALRIAVNDELGQLQTLLELVPRLVRAGGTVVFISFNSLEDRLVKRALGDRDVWERLTPKPVGPGDLERARNPRARSAKLRAARRLARADASPDGGAV
jgi:16S rRNA (cytosine1402-N4)-methyltransferase